MPVYSFQLEHIHEDMQRLQNDNESLRAQLKLKSGSANATFEEFYIDDLEKKLEAHRGHEAKLANDLQMARTLIKDLQDENAEFLTREKQLFKQLDKQTIPIIRGEDLKSRFT